MQSPRFSSTASKKNLECRSELLKSLRRYFDDLQFTEVQTPVLSQHTIIDRHLDPIVVPGLDGDMLSRGRDRYLQTSPEQNMKRLLACGLERIYQVGSVFRQGEFGDLHNPEFTLAEWYRVGDDLDSGILLLDKLLQTLLQTPAAKTVTYAEIFQDCVGLDPLVAGPSELAEKAVQSGLVASLAWSDDSDDWMDLLFSHLVQPKLGFALPTIVTHFPVSQAALARACKMDPRTAERFEYFDRGVELANGYHELLDPLVLRDRNAIANQQRDRAGRSKLPEDNLVLEAMEEGLPDCVGCALGFDRVVMLACGAHRLQDVLCFPWDRA